MTGAWLAWTTAPACAALLAYFLWRRGLRGRLFVDALAIGVTLGAAVAFAEAPFDLKRNPLHYSPQTIAFLFAGWPEEGAKMLGVAAFLRAHYLSRDRRDATLAAGALSLGFAALENIFYLVNAGAGWAALAVERALTAMPFHLFEGLAGGFVVASVAPNAFGVCVAVAAWLALGALHGLYDFAVFAGAQGAAPPAALLKLIAALGLDPGLTFKATLAGAEAAAALLAALALARLEAPAALAAPRWARFARSRAAGLSLGAPMALAAGLALAGSGLAGVALDTPDPFLSVATLAVSPLALGLLLIAGPARSPRGPLSPRARWATAALAGAATVAVGGAALIYGPAQWRTLTALRFETRAARLAVRGDDPGAVEAYGRALAAAPDRLEALSQRAAAYVRLARYDAALADIDAALRLAPNLIALYKQRADIDRQRNDPPATIADLDAALRRQPGDPELLAMRGQARIDARDPKGAYADLEAASRVAPDDPVVRRVLAAWDVDTGDYEAALRDLNARLHADPNDVSAAFQRGRVFLYKGDPARAIADFQHADRDKAFLYPALWRFLARARLQQEGAAELLARLAEAPDKWPAPVARMFVGLIGFDATRAAAANADERCEADFYFAALRLGHEPLNDVAAGLRAAMQECPTGFIEYEGAKAELRRAER